LGEENSILKREVSALKERLGKIEKELARVEKLEKSLAYHEIVLAKKVSDMSRFEEKMEKQVDIKMFDQMKKEIAALRKQEEIIFDNSRYIQEMLSEISRLRDSHRMAREDSSLSIKKSEFEDHVSEMKKEIRLLRGFKEIDIRPKKDPVQDINNKIDDLEYQNKLIIKYLKEIERRFLLKK
jgi:hypothetical protein